MPNKDKGGSSAREGKESFTSRVLSLTMFKREQEKSIKRIERKTDAP